MGFKPSRITGLLHNPKDRVDCDWIRLSLTLRRRHGGPDKHGQDTTRGQSGTSVTTPIMQIDHIGDLEDHEEVVEEMEEEETRRWPVGPSRTCDSNCRWTPT